MIPFPTSELPDSSSAACSFLLSWVLRMCLGTAVSLQGHLLGTCPRLWKLLLPSHSRPQNQRGTLEVRSLGGSRWEICPCLGTSGHVHKRHQEAGKCSFFLVQELGPASPVELRLQMQPHLPTCLQGQGSGSVLPAWLLLTGSSRFPSEFPSFSGLNQNFGAGKTPA